MTTIVEIKLAVITGGQTIIMKCTICHQELADDAPYRMYIPIQNNGGNGNGNGKDKRVCFTCHGCYEIITGDIGRVERNGNGGFRY